MPHWDSVYNLPCEAIDRIVVLHIQGKTNRQIIDHIFEIYVALVENDDGQRWIRNEIYAANGRERLLESDISQLIAKARHKGLYNEYAYHQGANSAFWRLASRYWKCMPRRLNDARGIQNPTQSFPVLYKGERLRTEIEAQALEDAIREERKRLFPPHVLGGQNGRAFAGGDPTFLIEW